jgi:hypothetical protein
MNENLKRLYGETPEVANGISRSVAVMAMHPLLDALTVESNLLVGVLSKEELRKVTICIFNALMGIQPPQ